MSEELEQNAPDAEVPPVTVDGEPTPEPTPDPYFEESRDGIDPTNGKTWAEQAKAQGWREDHDGPVQKTAQEFVEFGHNIQQHLKADKDALKADRDELKAQLENTNRMMETQRKVFQQQRERDLAQIDNQIDTAVESGDANAVRLLRKQADGIRSEEVSQNDAPQMDPTIAAWQKDNSWFQSPEHVFETTAAGAYADSLINANPNLTPAQITSQVDAKMKASFPQLYEEASPTTPRPKAPAVEAGRRAPRKTKAKGASDLPPDALAMAKRDVHAGTLESIDEYVKLYFENDKE